MSSSGVDIEDLVDSGFAGFDDVLCDSGRRSSLEGGS